MEKAAADQARLAALGAGLECCRVSGAGCGHDRCELDARLGGTATRGPFLCSVLSTEFHRPVARYQRWHPGKPVYDGASTAIGIAVSIPVGLGAAKNIAPRVVYYFCRGILALSRSFQEIILAIFFVKLFGFGPF